MSAVGRRYGKALFELAQSEKNIPQVVEGLDAISNAWRANRDLRELMRNPAMGNDLRRKTLELILTKLGVGLTLSSFVLLLSERGRLSSIADIRTAFKKMAEDSSGELTAEVTSASSLSEAFIKELEKSLSDATGRKVRVEAKVDPKVLGGISTRIGDRVFDGTIRNRLDDLRNRLMASSHQISSLN